MDATRRSRVDAIDLMRGLILVVMALDHVRDFWMSSRIDPTDAEHTTVALFATRWVTHLCAPWFMLLSGASAAFSLRHRDHRSLSSFLITRGLWLIVLELTLVNLEWRGPSYDPMSVRQMILCVLGGSMIALAGLSRLPSWAIAAFSISMIVGHDLTDDVDARSFGHLAWLWRILHDGGGFGARPGEGWSVIVMYPLVPWIGVMALGYVAGPWLFGRERPARALVIVGSVLLVAFAILRWRNGYGDFAPRQIFPSTVQTAMSFLEVSKYPPTLDFLLATIGVGSLVLAAIHVTQRARLWDAFRTYGRVPMFYYLVHLGLISATYQIGHRLVVHTWKRDVPWGFDLPIVYALWVAYVIALYPLCRWFGDLKSRRRDWWLSYL